MSQDELNGLDLSAVCRANNVRAEIVWPPADKHDENSNPYPSRQRWRWSKKDFGLILNKCFCLGSWSSVGERSMSSTRGMRSYGNWSTDDRSFAEVTPHARPQIRDQCLKWGIGHCLTACRFKKLRYLFNFSYHYFVSHLLYDMVTCNSGRVRIGILCEEGKNACLKHYQNFITSSVITVDISGIRAIYPYEFINQPLCQKIMSQQTYFFMQIKQYMRF